MISVKLCTKCGETKPVDQFSKNKSKHDGLHGRCKSCDNARTRVWYEANRERDLEGCRTWRAANKERAAATARARRNAAPEKHRAYVQKYRERHPDRIAAYAEATREQKNAYHKRWYALNLEDKRAKNRQWSKENPGKHGALCAKRRAQELKACPAWADLDAIALMYRIARRVSRQTGIKHEVDHIIPLRGKVVCGLHVETNLQLLTLQANRAKHARLFETV